jgi:hypothetical protein
LSEPTNRPALTGWQDGAILLGPAGGLVHLDGAFSRFAPTPGIEVQDGSLVRTVEGVTSSGDTLLAVGRELRTNGGVEIVRRAAVWRSDDAVTWELLVDRGLDEGTRPMRVRGVVTDPRDGAFLAYGEVLEEHEARLVVWRSTDGERWRVLPTPGLDRPGDVGGTEHIGGLALNANRLMALRVTTPSADLRTTEVVIGRRGGTFETDELPLGLGEIDLAAVDQDPSLTTSHGAFTLFANFADDITNPQGRRRVGLFTTEDGGQWSLQPLDGAVLPDPYFPQAVTDTAAGLVALAVTGTAVVLWQEP